jgi:hypothetical protein
MCTYIQITTFRDVYSQKTEGEVLVYKNREESNIKANTKWLCYPLVRYYATALISGFFQNKRK